MPCNYVFIDYENVQPDNLHKLIEQPVSVYTFVGEHQTKVSLAFTDAMLRLRGQTRLIQISGKGPNALDFHIAYYVGELAASDPEAYFHIVSKDSGFDPLIDYLRNKHTPALRIFRITDLEMLPMLRGADIGSPKERLALLTVNLQKRSPHLPKKASSLKSLIHAHFGKKLQPHEIEQMVDTLQKKKVLSITDGIVQYHLPVVEPVIALPKKLASG